MRISSIDPAEIDETAHFIASLNTDLTHRIGYFGEHPSEIRTTLLNMIPPAEEGTLVVREGDTMTGVMGIHLDAVLGRMWLHGPLVNDEEEWFQIAEELYRAIQPRIPPRITEFEIFCSQENERCQTFAKRKHFKLHGGAAIYAFPREALSTIPRATLPELMPQHYDDMIALQDRLFPRSYYSGRQIIKRLNELGKVFTTVDDETLTGYIYCRILPEARHGIVDFVGVLESARRQGNASRLLSAAFHWMFSHNEIDAVKLTVMKRNTAACQLYETVGFNLIHHMMAYRKRYSV